MGQLAVSSCNKSTKPISRIGCEIVMPHGWRMVLTLYVAHIGKSLSLPESCS